MDERTILLVIFVLHIIFDAIGDALRYNKRPFAYHFFEVLQVATMLCLLFVSVEFTTVIYLILAYGCLRFAIFDCLYNVLTRRNIMYIGESSFYDKILGNIFKTATSKSVLMGVRMCFLILGLYLIQYLIPFS